MLLRINTPELIPFQDPEENGLTASVGKRCLVYGIEWSEDEETEEREYHRQCGNDLFCRASDVSWIHILPSGQLYTLFGHPHCLCFSRCGRQLFFEAKIDRGSAITALKMSAYADMDCVNMTR